MKKTYTLFTLLILLFVSCKHAKPKLTTNRNLAKIDKRFRFIVGYWMMSSENSPSAIRTNYPSKLCPTLEFFDDFSGSLRRVDGVDIPFKWSTKNDFLYISYVKNDDERHDKIIDEGVFKFHYNRFTDDAGYKLTDTINRIEYELTK